LCALEAAASNLSFSGSWR